MFSINPKSIKYLETDRGVAFSADLLEDDNKVATVHNNGRGGATYLDLVDGWGTDVHKRLETEAEPHDGMEWYLNHLMDKAEGVDRLAEVHKLGQFISDNLK